MDGNITDERATHKKTFKGEGNKETGYISKEDAIRDGVNYGMRIVDANLE